MHFMLNSNKDSVRPEGMQFYAIEKAGGWEGEIF